MNLLLNVKNEEYLSPVDKNFIEDEVSNILEKAFNDNNIVNVLLLDIINALTCEESSNKDLKAISPLESIWKKNKFIIKQYSSKIMLNKLLLNKSIGFEAMLFINEQMSNYFYLYNMNANYRNKEILSVCENIFNCFDSMMNNIVKVEKSIDYGEKNKIIVNWLRLLELKECNNINSLYNIINGFYVVTNKCWQISDVILLMKEINKNIFININYKEYLKLFMLDSCITVSLLREESFKRKYGRAIKIRLSEALAMLLFNISIAKYKYNKHFQNMNINDLIKNAKLNIGEAQFNLANKYYFGYDVSKDTVKAEYWYNLGMVYGSIDAKNVLSEAAYNLARIFKIGKEVNKSYRQAIKWYKYSIKLGNSKAKYDLGTMYLYGVGIEKDVDIGLSLINESANEGNENASLLLASIYFKGMGVKKNNKKAFKRYMQVFFYGKKNCEVAYYKLKEL